MTGGDAHLAAHPGGHVDGRVVYGAFCTWWDSISAAAAKPSGLPCCPHCGSVLFEIGSETEWWAGVDQHEVDGHPGYRAYIEWMRGRCYPDRQAARFAYETTRTHPSNGNGAPAST